MKKFILLSVFVSLISTVLYAQCDGRYYDELFSVKSTSNIQFGANVDFNGDSVNLLMNVYEPEGDDFARRPLMVYAFGGSFTAGTRFSPDILTLCDKFAKRGYVTATIDYRLGFENGSDSDTNQFKALFRGIQDMRAALRFFYKDASSDNEFRIDTNQIFVGGVSAGAFIALNHGYFKDDTIFTNPPPDWVEAAYLEIGGIEGNSGNPGYSTKVKGVINLCGALADTLWIRPNDPVLVSVHGTADDLVSFTQDSNSVESLLMGSGLIHIRANNVGLPNFLYPFPGAGHVPFILPIPFLPPASQYMDTTVNTIRDFLFQNVICDSTKVTGIDNKDVQPEIAAYPNPSYNRITVRLNQTGEELFAELSDLTGKRLQVFAVGKNTNTFTLQKDEIGNGIFILALKNREGSVLQTKKLVFY